MRRKAEALREILDEFASQVQYPMLVVGCIEEELAYLLKFMEGLDETHPEAFLIQFCAPFTSRHGYLDGCVELLRIQIEAAREVREQRGETPFPPLPPELADTRQPPEHRLQRILTYLGGLVPNAEEHCVIVGLLPLTCSDFPAYAQLVGSVMPIPTPQPWMAPLRIVAYDNRTSPVLKPGMEQYQVEHVLYYQIDFTTPAVTDALTVDASDPTLPLPERMAALHQLAALDYSYRRYPDAIEKYGVLNEYYASVGVPSMQAICVNGAADAYLAGGQPQIAKELLQKGLALGLQAKALPALVNLFLSITDVCAGLGQHAEAESYADSGAKVAAGAMSPTVYADMFERKGDAQIAQNKVPEGLASYKKCEEFCKLYEYFFRWKSVLGKQIGVYERSAMRNEEGAARHQLALVDELEKRGGKAGAQAQAGGPAHAHGPGGHG